MTIEEKAGAGPADREKRGSARLGSWLLLVAWMAVMYAFSDQPYSGKVTEELLGPFNIAVRKAAHLSEYAILFILSRRAWLESLAGADRVRLSLLLALALSTAYAFLDEWHQAFVPGRSATISDALIDCSGVTAGWCLWLLYKRYRRGRTLPR